MHGPKQSACHAGSLAQRITMQVRQYPTLPILLPAAQKMSREIRRQVLYFLKSHRDKPVAF